MKLPYWTYSLLISAIMSVAGNSWAGIELTNQEIEALTQGKLVRKTFAGSGQDSTVAGVSFALINAEPKEVWTQVTKVPAWTSIFPNTYESKIVASKGSSNAVKMTLGNNLIELGFYLTVKFDKENWIASFELNKKKPTDIEDCKGSLRLLPQPGNRTLVVFTAMAKVPFSGLIKLMGRKVLGWIEHRIFSVPKRLKQTVYAYRSKK